jgi:hypothetical protein
MTMLKRIARVWKRCRSAVTGCFVSKDEVKANPRETICEVVRDEGDRL